jgi:hypothetical protein
MVRDPSVSAGDGSSPGSVDELPPATSHGYAEWDFSGVPDPVMFRWFPDATDYWFSYSDDSSAGSNDPARECCVVITNDQANATNTAEAQDFRLVEQVRSKMASGAADGRVEPQDHPK